MFLFKRKKDKEEIKKEEIPAINKEELIAKAQELEDKIPSEKGNSRIEAINEVASLYYKGEDVDKAIKYYEMSIEENKSLGKAYTDLLKLYNIKRRNAAEKNDGQNAQLYLDKIDELMKLSKDVIRGRV